MKKRIFLTLEFDEEDIFVDTALLNAAIFLEGIDFGFVFDCTSAHMSVDGLPLDYQDFLEDKIKNKSKDVFIND